MGNKKYYYDAKQYLLMGNFFILYTAQIVACKNI